MRTTLLRLICGGSLLAFLSACGRGADAPPGASPAEPSRASPPVHYTRHEDWVAPYPRGRWRLSNPAALDHSVLWVSHILIRHREVPPSIICFKPAFWFVAAPVPERTRAQALELARSVAEAAAATPARFADFAARYSEDVTTRDIGGSLGGVPASELSLNTELIDALAAIRIGEVSQVVESSCGFHVLLRRQPPPEETVSGAHVVIGYDDAPWLRTYVARRPIPKRSREEALWLANQIYKQAGKDPSSFSRLVDEHSEHADALRGGDMGAWSTREAVPVPREVETLQGLAVGQVAPPFDSLFGIQVLQRIPNRPRQRYAATFIQVPFGDSSEAARQLAKSASEELARTPSAFGLLQERFSSPKGVMTWTEGRPAAEVEVATKLLSMGQWTVEPLRVDSLAAYVIIKREAVEPLPEPPPETVAFDVPSPAKIDVEYLLSERLTPAIARRTLVDMGSWASNLFRDQPEIAARLTAMHDVHGQANADLESNELMVAYHDLLRRVGALIGEAKFAQYQAAFDQTVEALVLNGQNGID